MITRKMLKIFSIIISLGFATYALAQPSISITEMAYVLADKPTTKSYTPNLDAQYNSSGAINTITRQDDGKYTVTMPNLIGGHGSVQVTALGNIVDCRMHSLSISGNNLIAKVYCSRDIESNSGSKVGTYIDTQFYLTYLSAR